MRFFFILEGLAVHLGGPPRVAAAVANRLVDRGHHVTIGSVPMDSELVSIADDIEVLPIARGATLTNAASAARRISRVAAAADATIVSGIWGPLDGLAIRLARVPPQKLFIRSCGMLEPYILNRSRLKKRLARIGYVDHNLQRAASVLANTPIEQTYIQEMYPSANVRVVPNGVVLPDLGSFDRECCLRTLALNVPDNAKCLLYLGRIDPKKGLDVLLPEFRKLAASHPEWNLIVAGSFKNSEYESLILRQAAQIPNKVHFVGEVRDERKNACFQLADGFVLPSHSEGFPNAVVEALSWGVPSLVTRGCNFPEVEAARAGLVSELEPNELSSRLHEFCLQTDLNEAGQCARQLVESKYTLDRVVDLYEQLSVA